MIDHDRYLELAATSVDFPLSADEERELADHLAGCRSCSLEAAGFRVNYVAVRDPETLKPLHGPVKQARVLAAAFLGKTRLIDNVKVPPTNR